VGVWGRVIDGRVLVVDDDAAITESVAIVLRDQGCRVWQASGYTEALQAAVAHRPHVAVVDVGLGAGPDGFMLARRLLSIGTESIVFLTAHSDLNRRLEGFDVGADDFISKPFAMQELVARIGALLRRLGVAADRRWELGDLTLDEGTHDVVYCGQAVELTATQFALLKELARHSPRVVAKARLLATVWDYDAGSDANLIEVHMSALRRKLEDHGPRVIQTVRGAGYRLAP
jgi:two-component system, OmpR family, response regulator